MENEEWRVESLEWGRAFGRNYDLPMTAVVAYSHTPLQCMREEVVGRGGGQGMPCPCGKVENDFIQRMGFWIPFDRIV